MNDEQATEAAGRLLLRYGWPAPDEAVRRFAPTERQSTRNRLMNDPETQQGAVKELAELDELAAVELVELCKARRHYDASSRARFLVTKHA